MTKRARMPQETRAAAGGGEDKGEAADASSRASAARSVTFRASIPPQETAIKIHGEGGARMMLDVAEADLGAFLPALALRGRVLRVTMEGWSDEAGDIR